MNGERAEADSHRNFRQLLCKRIEEYLNLIKIDKTIIELFRDTPHELLSFLDSEVN
jgi:hypothetical protein